MKPYQRIIVNDVYAEHEQTLPEIGDTYPIVKVGTPSRTPDYMKDFKTTAKVCKHDDGSTYVLIEQIDTKHKKGVGMTIYEEQARQFKMVIDEFLDNGH